MSFEEKEKREDEDKVIAEKMKQLAPRERIIVCLRAMMHLGKETAFLSRQDLAKNMEDMVPEILQEINFNYYLNVLINKERMIKETYFGNNGHKKYFLTKKAEKMIDENSELLEIFREITAKEAGFEAAHKKNKGNDLEISGKRPEKEIAENIVEEAGVFEDLKKLLAEQIKIQRFMLFRLNTINDGVLDLTKLLTAIAENQGEILEYLKEIKSVKEMQEKAENLKRELRDALNSS